MPGHGDPVLHAQNNIWFGHVRASHATTKLYALQQHIFVWKRLKTQPAQQTQADFQAWKTALPEIQPEVLLYALKNNRLFPKGKKKVKTTAKH